MRIYKMTATFGKLEHETLTLQPGLNVITAPNEWGKSTWCAFLMAMLYGIDTRVKSTKTTLADKERYAPWSGSPMSGRIDLNWNGRDITIERKTAKRVPLGEFRAYETASGVLVEELTAANCGQMLLGVEQSVFRRAGFVRQANMAVTQDEALRRRLTALVTTGDESGAADRLAAQLKELKNQCRYNRTGLLPQAEAERENLEQTLAEWDSLNTKCQKTKMRIDEVKSWLSQLYNHQQALAYAAAEENARRLAQAGEDLAQAEQNLARWESVCQSQPPREEAEQKLREMKTFRDEWNAIQAEHQALPGEPQRPKMPHPFTNMTPEEARRMAQKDMGIYQDLLNNKLPRILFIVGAVGLVVAGVLWFFTAYLFAALAGFAGVAAIGWGITELVNVNRNKKNLVEKYDSSQFAQWADPIDVYLSEEEHYEEVLREYKELAGDVEVRLMVMRNRRDALCGDQDPDALLDYWQQTVSNWEGYYTARRETAQLKRHHDDLKALVKPVEKPTMPDNLTQSEGETKRLLTECAVEQQRLQNRLGQYQGRMETLGDRETLARQLEQKKARLARLEDVYTALIIAQETLARAQAEMQRRFAPRITRRAQVFLSRMTRGRYQSLVMCDDFSLETKTEEEDVLSDSLWRSDGTLDQLYLALRLAVAEELTPQAPLILDDALVRFDDGRLKAAMKLLQELGTDKQILCFTCQSRESKALSEAK